MTPDHIIRMVEILAWPGVALGGLLVFRLPLTRLIDQIQHAKTQIGEFSRSQRDAVSDAAPGPLTEKFLATFGTHGLIGKLEESIRLDPTFIESQGEARERVLTRSLAVHQLAAFFERTYGAIFGSQIKALLQLNNRGSKGMTISELSPFHSGSATFWNGLPSKFEDWLQFMTASNLIAKSGDNFAISELGRGFLDYLQEQNYSHARPN